MLSRLLINPLMHLDIQKLHIALVGNPNSGKTSLFNCLTGLHQQTGNFPGVTVDKKTGTTRLNEKLDARVIDLPGTYSLYPKRLDEWVSYRVLLNQDKELQADVIVAVADASNLKRNLLFCTQIIDLKQPVVIVLTMMDLARKKGIRIDTEILEKEFGVPVVAVNPRKNKGISELKKAIVQVAESAGRATTADFIDTGALAPEPIRDFKKLYPCFSDYKSVHYLINHEQFDLDATTQEEIEQIEIRNKFNPTKTHAEVL